MRILTLLLGLLVITVFLATSSAHAAATASSPVSHPRTAVTSEEEEEEGERDEEEIEVELEFEEGEEAEEPISLPPECLLRTIEPRVLARFNHDDLRLILRYTSDASVRTNVAYWLKGARGTARLGSTTRRLGQRGVLEMSRHLDSRTLAKLHAARVIVVRLEVPGTPGFCKRYLTMRLTAQRLLGRSATWYEPA